MPNLTLITEPAEEPITLEEAKEHLRIGIEDTDEEGLITSLITAARLHVEDITNRALVKQEWDLQLDEFPDGSNDNYGGIICLPKGRTISVTHVKYKETSAGTLTTIASSQYTVDTVSEPGRLLPAYGYSWPTTRDDVAAVQVRYYAGYGEPNAVPEPIKTYIKLMVGTMFLNRETEITEGTKVQLGFADALLAPYRMWSFG